MPFENLPLDVTATIMGFIPLTERLPMRLVSSDFNKAVVLSVRRNPLEKLAFKVAQECYEGPIGLHSKIRAEIFKNVTVANRAEFNDSLIAAFMEISELNVGEMLNLINENPLLRNGPARINSVQLAEQLGLVYTD